MTNRQIEIAKVERLQKARILFFALCNSASAKEKAYMHKILIGRLESNHTLVDSYEYLIEKATMSRIESE